MENTRGKEEIQLEIERKYLVGGEFKQFATEQHRITQAYICNDPERSVRIRSYSNKAFLTIKGGLLEDGQSRIEWEKEISLSDARNLMRLVDSLPIVKTRYIVPFEGLIIEVDEFHDQNEGLLLAEIELDTPERLIKLPSWISREVTGDKKYYNPYLSKHPYSTWEDQSLSE